jgi:hypothetical protein
MGQTFSALAQYAEAKMERELDLDFAEAKRILWKVMKDVGARHGFTWQINEVLGGKINLMLKYFLNHQDGKLDPYKGLVLFGKTGTGKTRLMESFFWFTHATGFRKFRMASTSKVILKIQAEKDLGGIDQYMEGAWCFDDYLLEGEVNVFGNKVDVFNQILDVRYSDQLMTHLTMNVTSIDQLQEQIPHRLFSRFLEMFNFIEVPAEKDFRILQQ